MFIVFPPVDAPPPAMPSAPTSNFTLVPPVTGMGPGSAFPPAGALAMGSQPIQPNQWLLGAVQPQSMESVLFTPAGPYPLPSFPIIPIPPPPIVVTGVYPPFIAVGLAQ